jgi:hypothetical protein
LLFLELCHLFEVYVKCFVAGFCYKLFTPSGFFGGVSCCFGLVFVYCL